MLIYCPMEALAYLASHGILPVSIANQKRLWLWSCRCWALYVSLQLLHLVEDNRLLRLRARALEKSTGHAMPGTAAVAIIAPSRSGPSVSEKTIEAASGTEMTADEELSEELSEKQAITRRLWDDLAERKQTILGELWVNLGYLPLTVHWSCSSGIFSSEVWVGLFGTIAAVAGLRPGWKATALPSP